MQPSRASMRPTFARGRYRRGQMPASVPEGAFDAFHLRGELPMSAHANVKPDFEEPEDRQLADDIARVMHHHRPLMSRLARVETAHGPAALGRSANAGLSPASQETPPEVVLARVPPDPRSLDEVLDDLGHVATPPPSAKWLDHARRAHRRARMRQAAAWVTTLAIAVSIIGVALALLRV